jgi:hypothetical protein
MFRAWAEIRIVGKAAAKRIIAQLIIQMFLTGSRMGPRKARPMKM